MPSPEELLEHLTVPTRLGEKPGLDRMRRLLAELGNPHHGLPVIHVGGTSGKGSTATIAAAVLRTAGYRVGLHVKPHLERVEERFVIDGVPIDSGRLVALLADAAPIAAAIRPSWYELTVATALRYFHEERVDLAVVEVGLGGTYDGTNLVEPLSVVLTNVGLDHTDVLGHTVEEIARDKVGIVKPGVPTVSGMTQPSVRPIVEQRCERVGAPLWQLGREIDYSINALGARGASFDLRLPGWSATGLELSLLGAHQVANAALAVAAVRALGPSRYPVSDPALRQALAAVKVDGRLEIIDTDPLIVLDGAHNPDKMSAFAQALKDLFPDRKVTAVLGFKRGHDLTATLAPLVPLLQRAVLSRFDADTDFGKGQSVEPALIEQACASLGAPFERVSEADPIRAVKLALDHAGPRDLVCVTGSLYLVGAVRPWLRGQG